MKRVMLVEYLCYFIMLWSSSWGASQRRPHLSWDLCLKKEQNLCMQVEGRIISTKALGWVFASIWGNSRRLSGGISAVSRWQTWDQVTQLCSQIMVTLWIMKKAFVWNGKPLSVDKVLHDLHFIWIVLIGGNKP